MKKQSMKKTLLTLMLASSLGAGIVLPTVCHDVLQVEAAMVRPEQSGADNGTLHINKFFGAETDLTNDGTEIDTSKLPNHQPLTGVKFKVYKILGNTSTAEDAPKLPYGNEGSGNQQFTYKIVNANGKDYLHVFKNGSTDKVQEFEAEFVKEETTKAGVATIDGLNGLYYVEENVNGSKPTLPNGKEVGIANGITSFLTQVPMKDPNWKPTQPEPNETPNPNEGWIKDVHVYPKNQGGTLEKGLQQPTASVELGKEFGWEIKADITEEFGGLEKFVIWDELDYRLDLISTKISVHYDGKDGKEKTLSTPDHYTLSTEKVTINGKKVDKFTVKLNSDGIKLIGGTKAANWSDRDGLAGGDLKVRFNTKVNSNAFPVKEDNIIDNKATLEFENENGNSGKVTTTPPGNPDPQDPTDPSKPVINIGDIIIDKKDQEKKPLVGTEFKLLKGGSDTKADGAVEMEVLLDANNNVVRVGTGLTAETGQEKRIWRVLPGYTGANEQEFDIEGGNVTKVGTTAIVTDTHYYTTHFDGLQTHSVGAETSAGSGKYDITLINYWLVETKTKDGYNLLDGPQHVAFSEKDKTFVITSEVINTNKFTLPATGGPGLIILTIAGIVIVGMGIMVALPKKRKS